MTARAISTDYSEYLEGEPMIVTAANRTAIATTLTRLELQIFCNALNEVCHGLRIDDFPAVIGAEKAEAVYLHESLLVVRAAQDAWERGRPDA